MKQQLIQNHLSRLVSFYPQSQNQEAVLQALEYCKNILKQSESFKDCKIHQNNGYYSLTASTSGTKTPKLLLQSHIDVVPSQNKPKYELSNDGKVIKGRGVYDMLFAVAAYLAFIEENESKLKDLNFGIMLTGDEELGGMDGVGYLVDKGFTGEICFLPDAGEGFGDLSISAKGAYNFDLVAIGKSHHGSRPWEGDGAANKLIHMLHELMDAFDHSNHHNSTVTVTRFDGGGAINKGPSKASAHLDIRFKDAADYKRIKKVVGQICQEYGGEVQNILHAEDLDIDISNLAIQDFIKLYEKHSGKPITMSKAHGGSDARYFADKGIPVIMIRPDGTGAHSDEETLSVDSYKLFCKLLSEYILAVA